MSQPPRDTLIDDLDVMFCAVKTRLRCIGNGAVEPAAVSAIEANNRLCKSVLECAGALDRLHVMLAEEVEQRRQLEQIFSDAEARLARAPPELVAVLGITLRTPPVARLLASASVAARAR